MGMVYAMAYIGNGRARLECDGSVFYATWEEADYVARWWAAEDPEGVYVAVGGASADQLRERFGHV